MRGLTVIMLHALVTRARAEDMAANKIVDDLFNRALSASFLHHENLDEATQGKAGHLAMPTQLSSTPLLPLRGGRPAAGFPGPGPQLRGPATPAGWPRRASHGRLRDMTVRAVEEESKSEKAAATGLQASDRQALDERFTNIDALLGPTTAAPTMAPRPKSVTTPAPLNLNMGKNLPKIPKGGDLKDGVRDSAVSALSAYQGLLAFRFLLDWLSLVGLDPNKPPWQGFRLLTDPYLSLFGILGPFSFIAGFYVLSFLRDYINQQWR